MSAALSGIAVVEGQPVAQLEAVVQTVLADRPGFGQVGQRDRARCRIGRGWRRCSATSLAGDDAEVDLGRIEIRDLADAEAELERAAGLRFALAPARRTARVRWGSARRRPPPAGSRSRWRPAGGGEGEQGAPRDAWSAQNAPVDPCHRWFLLWIRSLRPGRMTSWPVATAGLHGETTRCLVRSLGHDAQDLKLKHLGRDRRHLLSVVKKRGALGRFGRPLDVPSYSTMSARHSR